MVSHEVTFLTRPSLARLQERLGSLRPRLTQSMREVHEAAAYGDLTENFEWEAAKHQRELLKAEIVKIEAQLANYQLIEELQVGGEKVTIGTRSRWRMWARERQSPTRSWGPRTWISRGISSPTHRPSRGSS